MQPARLQAPVWGRPMNSRYQLAVTAGTTRVTQDCPTLDIAQTAFDRFCQRNADNWNAVAEIFDRETQAVIARWTGFPKSKPAPTVGDIFARLIAAGQPVSIIGPDGSATFNEPKPSSQSRPRRAAA